jgi:hypothetical protein
MAVIAPADPAVADKMAIGRADPVVGGTVRDDPEVVVRTEIALVAPVVADRMVIDPGALEAEIAQAVVIDPDDPASAPTGLVAISRGIQGRVAIGPIAPAMAIVPATVGGITITFTTAPTGPTVRVPATSTIVGRDPIAQDGTTGMVIIPIAARGGTIGVTTFATTGGTTTTIGSPRIGGTSTTTTSVAGITATALIAIRIRTGGRCRPTPR